MRFTHFCIDILYFLVISLYLFFPINSKSLDTIVSNNALSIPRFLICIIKHSDKFLAPTPTGSNCCTIFKHISNKLLVIFNSSIIYFSSILKYPSSSKLSII